MNRIASNLVCAMIFVLAPIIGAAETMNVEIDYLLETVAESDCTFIRNGKEYAAIAARDHLQMKRERGRKYYESTEQFIDRIASKSSWSGKPYMIRCADTEITASEWFTRALADFRAKNGDIAGLVH